MLVRVINTGKPVPQGTGAEVVVPGTDKRNTVKQVLAVRPGLNVIEVRVLGSDGALETVGERRVTVLRKPFIQTVGHTQPDRKRKTSLTLAVRSADPLTAVLVNGRGRPFKDVPREGGGRTLTVADVQLTAGTNRLTVAAVNADGRSPESLLTVAAPDRARDERRRA
ncbi:MAG TPA: hypothetical protein VM597_39130, partial [Gemmataceae bacterium]|nr:hypothetical protein [Gemmataceae bacterium]